MDDLHRCGEEICDDHINTMVFLHLLEELEEVKGLG